MRSIRSTAMLGAAAALALVGTGLIGIGPAVADDSPTPDPTTSDATVVTEPPVDPNGPALPSLKMAKKHGSAGHATAPSHPLSTAPVVPLTTANSFSHAATLSQPDLYWPYADFDTTAATVQSGEPRALNAGYYLTHTVWAKWKPIVSGYVTVSTFTGTSGDTGINVYTGTWGHLKRVAWNDEQYDPVDGGGLSGSAYPSGEATILSLKVTKGVTYYFQVGTAVAGTSSTAGTGFADLTLSIEVNRYTVTNDFFADAASLSWTAGSNASKTWRALVNGSTVEGWEPVDNPDAADPSTEPQLRDATIWYKFNAPQTGLLVLSACAPFDYPTVAVYSTSVDDEGAGVGYGDLKSIAFDGNNAPSSCTGISGGASVVFVAQQNETYYFQIAHTTGGLGAYYMDLGLSGVFLQPYIDKLSKTSGHVGATITITGQSLHSGTPVVKFGTKTATIVSMPTPTTIVVKVPSVPKGNYLVTVTNTSPTPDDISNKVAFKVY